MQKENRNEESDDLAAIGIGVMIVFIALILVAAVASAVIIQTGEKLQQNAQQAGSDTQQEISGKISIITVWVGAQTAGAEEITVVFETAPGSEPIVDTSVHWSVICDGGGAVPGVKDGDFNGGGDTVAAAVELDTTAITGGIFLPGNAYMISFAVGDATAADNCEPDVNEEHVLVISVDGGGATYETLSYTSETQGDIVV